MNKNIEELNDELWISDLACLVDVTGYLNGLRKEMQDKDHLLTEI
jgi:hypothetical protein